MQTLKDAIRKVLREGFLRAEDGKIHHQFICKPASVEAALHLLLRIVPEEEYHRRSIVGNRVHHKIYGEGVIKRVTSTGNVEVEFADKCVKLKPDYFQIVT